MLVVGTGCSRVGEIDDPTVATYKDGTVTARELDRWLTARDHSEPPADLLPEIEELVLVRVLAESGTAAALADEPSMARRLEDAEKATLERALKRHTAESVTVADEEIDAVVASDPLGFDRPRSVRLKNLFKRFPPNGSEQDREQIRLRMEELHQQLMAGGDMSALALAESDSETRYRGGLMGTIEEGQLPPALDAIVMNLPEGEVSEIIESRDGLTMIQCDAVIPAKKHGATEVRSMAEANIARNRRRQAIVDLDAELLAAADLEISMDLALDPECPPDQAIANFGAHSVSRAHLDELAAARRSPRGRAQELNEAQARAILESYAISTTAAERARKVGLVDDDLMSSVDHRQQVILATEELNRRVGLQLVVPTDAEIIEYFEANRAVFRSPSQIDLETIRFPFTPESLQEVSHQARQTLDAIDSDRPGVKSDLRLYSGASDSTGEYSKLTLTDRQLAAYGPAVG